MGPRNFTYTNCLLITTSSYSGEIAVNDDEAGMRSRQRGSGLLRLIRKLSLRYRISCESYSQTLALLFFGGPHSSHGHWFGLGCSRLLLDLCRCTLRTFATKTARKPASVIRVNLCVLLSPRNGYIRERLLTNSSLFSVSTWISTRSAVCPWLLWLVTAYPSSMWACSRMLNRTSRPESRRILSQIES
jgi:hypothetical protein